MVRRYTSYTTDGHYGPVEIVKIRKKSDPLDFINDIIEDVTGTPIDPKLKSLYGNLNIFKCLSVKQPWADLIVKGIKDVENRTWECPHRGPLLIQSTGKYDSAAYTAMNQMKDTRKFLKPTIDDYLRQYLLGIVFVKDIKKNYRKSDWMQPGMFQWILEYPLEFKNPIHAKGTLGVWKYDGDSGVIRKEIKDSMRK